MCIYKYVTSKSKKQCIFIEVHDTHIDGPEVLGDHRQNLKQRPFELFLYLYKIVTNIYIYTLDTSRNIHIKHQINKKDTYYNIILKVSSSIYDHVVDTLWSSTIRHLPVDLLNA